MFPVTNFNILDAFFFILTRHRKEMTDFCVAMKHKMILRIVFENIIVLVGEGPLNLYLNVTYLTSEQFYTTNTGILQGVVGLRFHTPDIV
jgi:hypothetical protein